MADVLPMRRVESGADKLRRVVRVLDQCNESALDGFTPEELIKLVEACWASDWDVWPDNLKAEERRFAASTGKLSAETEQRLEDMWG